MIKRLLDEKIEKNLQYLNDSCDAGIESDGAKYALHELEVLEELRLEEMRASNEAKRQKFEQWVSTGLQIGAMIIPIIAYDIWYRRGLRFEEHGTIGSPMVRNLMTRLLPNKKG